MPVEWTRLFSFAAKLPSRAGHPSVRKGKSAAPLPAKLLRTGWLVKRTEITNYSTELTLEQRSFPTRPPAAGRARSQERGCPPSLGMDNVDAGELPARSLPGQVNEEGYQS